MGRGGSKKCKPIPAPPRDAGLKSHPIPAPPPLRGGENPHGAKRGGAGKNCHPYAEKRKEAESEKKDIPRKRNAESSTTHQYREKSEKKTLRAMIGSKREK